MRTGMSMKQTQMKPLLASNKKDGRQNNRMSVNSYQDNLTSFRPTANQEATNQSNSPPGKKDVDPIDQSVAKA